MAATAPFAMKAAPWIAQGVGALFGRKLSGPSKEQKGAMTGAQQGAETLTSVGRPLVETGLQTTAPAADYYRNILTSRRSATEALAPETTTALEYYRGAEGKTRRTMQGGARDVALAELDRQKVGQLAGMLPAARRGAAEGAGALGTSLTGQGTQALANAGYLQGGLFNMASQLRAQQGAGGQAWGGFLYDLLSQFPWGKGGKAPLQGRSIYTAMPAPSAAATNPYYG